VALRPRIPFIGRVRGVLRKLLRAPGITQVVRLRQMIPDRAWVIQRLGGIYKGLTASERTKLYDIGLAAQRAAMEFGNLSPDARLPLGQIPMNEHLGATVDRGARGQALIGIDDVNIDFTREGGWQFYVDTEFVGTREQFETMARARAKEIVLKEAAYHRDMQMPPDIQIELKPIWIARGF